MSQVFLRAILRRLDDVERQLRNPDRSRTPSHLPRDVSHIKPAVLQVIDSVAAATHSPRLVTALDVQHAAAGIGIGDDVFCQALAELEIEDVIGLELARPAFLPDPGCGVPFGPRGILLFITRPV